MAATIESLVSNISLIATLVLANYVLAAICAVREVYASRTSQGSIAWLVSLAFLPFPTAFIYMVFGWKHFDSYTKARHKIRHNRILRAEELKVIDRETGRDWPVLVRASGLPFISGNDCELLIDGEAIFAAILAEIAKARHFILIQFYIINDDGLGQRFADALIERAEAGVAVHVLYDDVGSNKLPHAYIRRLKAAGIHVSAFNERHGLLRLFGPMRINYRNHRKNVVVDGEVAFTGGANVGDEYLGLSPKFGHWRDTQLRVRGAAAQGFVLVFREDWSWATGEELDLPLPDSLAPRGDTPALLMATGPADKFEACAIAYADIIGQARERLWVVSPYFVPDTDMRTALYAAALRGVDVRIMLPAKPDHRLVWLASNAHADAMVEHGVAVYRYTKGFLHQKVLLMDDRIATVGSVNFDNRSFAINFEMSVWMPSPRMVEAVAAMLETDFSACRLVTREEVQKRKPVRKLIESGARLFSPIL